MFKWLFRNKEDYEPMLIDEARLDTYIRKETLEESIQRIFREDNDESNRSSGSDAERQG